MRFKSVTKGVFAVLLLSAPAAVAQDEVRSEFSAQGTGFFTKDTRDNGNTAQSTNTGGFVVGYRFHFNHWLAADASYGYDRITQLSTNFAGPTGVQANVHEATGALVLTLPFSVARFKPYALAGAGALVFDPTGNAGGFVAGAQSQGRPTFVYGAGADYNISSHIALRAQYRGFVYNRPDFSLAGLDSHMLAHTAEPSAGIVFRF